MQSIAPLDHYDRHALRLRRNTGRLAGMLHIDADDNVFGGLAVHHAIAHIDTGHAGAFQPLLLVPRFDLGRLLYRDWFHGRLPRDAPVRRLARHRPVAVKDI
jgi:hypothetical protein